MRGGGRDLEVKDVEHKLHKFAALAASQFIKLRAHFLLDGGEGGAACMRVKAEHEADILLRARACHLRRQRRRTALRTFTCLCSTAGNRALVGCRRRRRDRGLLSSTAVNERKTKILSQRKGEVGYLFYSKEVALTCEVVILPPVDSSSSSASE
jgi:hypothetical protein